MFTARHIVSAIDFFPFVRSIIAMLPALLGVTGVWLANPIAELAAIGLLATFMLGALSASGMATKLLCLEIHIKKGSYLSAFQIAALFILGIVKFLLTTSYRRYTEIKQGKKMQSIKIAQHLPIYNKKHHKTCGAFCLARLEDSISHLRLRSCCFFFSALGMDIDNCRKSADFGYGF